MDLDVSVGAIGLLITLVYVAATVLVVTILIVGLIVLLKVNRLLSERLKTQNSSAPHATTHIPPVPSTPPAQNPPAPSAPSAPDAIRD